MKAEAKEIYKCDYCNKLYQKKHLCAYHESVCYKNPDNARVCFGCNNLVKMETVVYSGRIHPDGDEATRKVNLFFCKKLETYLHTPKNEVKGNAFETGDYDNIPMKKECEFYEQQRFDI